MNALFASPALTSGDFLAPAIILAVLAPLAALLWAFDKSYFSFDRRTMGLVRILLGWFLIADLFRRGVDWEAMFGDKGVLPTWVILNRPQAGGFSLLHGFTTGPELWALFLVILATYVCLLVGYKTKLAQWLSLLFVTSMNGRVLLIENGGYVVHNLLLLWTCFLPLGDRFSLDSFLSSMRRKRERSAAELNDRSDVLEERQLAPFISLVGMVFAFQIAAIYYFNFVHKTGPGWRREFTAVHYVMYVDRMVNPLIGVVRDYVPSFVWKIMTAMVYFSEATLPFCAALPRVVLYDLDVKLWLRRGAIVLMNFLHIGFGSTFVLGPFAWALCVMSCVFISYEDWEVSIKAMRKPEREITVIYDPRSGAALFFSRLLARFDRFSLIGFDEAKTEERSERILVLTQDGKTLTNAAAIGAIVRALPIGPAVAWMFDGRFAPLRGITDALLARSRGRASRWLGLSTELPPAVPTLPLRVRFRRVGKIVSEVVCAVFFLGAVNQGLVELWATKKPWSAAMKWVSTKTGVQADTQPEPTRLVTHKLRFLQGWFMFSPNPVMDDGTVIVDAITIDGRHVDPFWNAPPNFDLLHAKSFGYNQIWSDYFNRIHMGGNKQFRDSMVDYMRRLPERTGNPNDQLVSGDVYWVRDMNPRYGTTESFAQANDLLFSFGEVGGARDPKAAVADKPDS